LGKAPHYTIKRVGKNTIRWDIGRLKSADASGAGGRPVGEFAWGGEGPFVIREGLRGALARKETA